MCVVRETVAKQAMDVYENRICTLVLRCVCTYNTPLLLICDVLLSLSLSSDAAIMNKCAGV